MDPDLVALAVQAVQGQPRAWRELWARIEPLVWGLTGKWQILGPLCRRHEERHDVVVRVMERLREHDFRRLRAFLDSPSSRDERVLRAWLCTVSTRVAIDYARAHPECVDPRGRRGGERWVQMVPLSELGAGPALDPVRRLQVLGVLERARSELRPDQLLALAAWLEGEDAAGIATRLGLDDDKEAQRTLRSALKRLRDRYAQSSGDSPAEHSS